MANHPNRSKMLIEIYGGFHNQTQPICVRVPREIIKGWGEHYGWSHLMDSLSDRTRAKVANHMCGMRDCLCGTHHGWKWDQV